MLYAILTWLCTSFFVGYIGRHRALGFWGVFIFSLLFSPLVGVLALWVCRSGQLERGMPAKYARLLTQYRSLLSDLTQMRVESERTRQQIAILEAELKQVPTGTSSR